ILIPRFCPDVLTAQRGIPPIGFTGQVGGCSILPACRMQKAILCSRRRFAFMLPKGDAKKVTMYLNQDTRTHMEPLWAAVLAFLRHKHVAGATLLRADAGFGTHEQFHDPRSESLAEHTPVRIEFVETGQRIDELLA